MGGRRRRRGGSKRERRAQAGRFSLSLAASARTTRPAHCGRAGGDGAPDLRSKQGAHRNSSSSAWQRGLGIYRARKGSEGSVPRPAVFRRARLAARLLFFRTKGPIAARHISAIPPVRTITTAATAPRSRAMTGDCKTALARTTAKHCEPSLLPHALLGGPDSQARGVCQRGAYRSRTL
ncbi:hypothetical protein BJY59DRAFT_482670 [Rhodotorula toruloides]